MHLYKNQAFGLATLGLFTGFTMATVQGCDEGGGPLGDLAEQCGLTCPSDGILEGNASISGIASLDAFFGAVIDVQVAAANVSTSVRAELDAMAVSVGLSAGAGSAEIAAAVKGKLEASVSGGLKIDYQPAKCSASVEVSAKAAAECDASVDPGMVSAECSGSCEVEASAMASCSGDATLKCEGTAPNLQCEGSCKGDCELEVAASCEGTCRGTCMGTCSVQDAQGNCAGECNGMCQGTCEMKAGGSCSGSCSGSCEYTPPSGGCEANARASCEAGASGKVECEGKCTGEVKPPMVKAECEATVEAKANASVECTPPSLQVTWQWSADLEGDLQAQAEFKAWLEGFKAQFAAILAAGAKAELVLKSAQIMVNAGADAVGDAAGELKGSGSIKAKIGAGCAILALDDVGQALGAATANLQFSATAMVDVAGVVN